MSKKRKRDTDSVAAEKPVHGPIDADSSPIAAESPKTDKPHKKDKKDKKDKKQRRGQERSGQSSSSRVQSASLAAPPDPIPGGENGEGGRGIPESVGHRRREEADSDNLDDLAPLKENGAEEDKDKRKTTKDDGLSTGHLSILSKFDKYRAEVLGAISKTSATKTEPATEQLQGLHPLPLPPQAPAQKVDPTSVLPVYLSQPTTVPTTQKSPFDSFNLPDRLLDRLRDLKITHAFPVQSALLPLLLPAGQQPSSLPRADLLVSAATGSGKTLSYLLPVLSSLQNRIISRTYALIIVPTHELATQVQKTAQFLSSGTSLKISTAVGARPFDAEKDYIIANDVGSTGADILIATPGRLVEHIRKNPHFTLRYLQWLIVDEADRLLSQSFQDWVDILGEELQKPFDAQEPSKKTGFDVTSLGLRPMRCAADNVRKVILSATMTRDVGKLAGLKLRRPQLIAVDDVGGREIPMGDIDIADGKTDNKPVNTEIKELNFLPPALEEHCYPISDLSQKPLVLSKLLLENTISSGILIFTKSNESAVRLGRLLQILLERKELQRWAVAVSTSDKRKREISANTAKFKSSAIDVLISTDLLARGVDLPNAQLVINYDSPRNEKDYIHRVGRTARAGNRGVAWSLVEEAEAKWWWAGIGKVRRGNTEGISKESTPIIGDEDVEKYESALETLGREVRGP
ncbi:ATP-dependent RNA helicase dbp6 [Orbilia brochopaga]|uniref:ATP-dependent RNA helicase n=1 Tax=Orbilia brochopaga TaxID=3140254 RepID=A0AAV9V1V9_9PEZI